MLQYTTGVQPISCDEAFLDVTGASLHHDGSPRKDGGIFPLERNLTCAVFVMLPNAIVKPRAARARARAHTHLTLYVLLSLGGLAQA